MPKAAGDAMLLVQSLTKAYAATPTNLKVIFSFFPHYIVIFFSSATGDCQVTDPLLVLRGSLTCMPFSPWPLPLFR